MGVAGFTCYSHFVHQTPLQIFKDFVQFLETHPAGPAVFILAFCVRPMTMLPAALYNLAAGYCFGGAWGFVWGHLAGTVAAALVYGIGRWMGLRTGVARWIDWCINLLRTHGVLSVVVLRFCFLPYDAVSYLGGALRLPFFRFLLASFIGNLPGTTSVVLIGASLEGQFEGGNVSLNWRLLAVSWVMLVAMLGVGRWLRRRVLPDAKKDLKEPECP
ncbi:MAG: VTT domain-containing protein [Candidatus Eremiobacteraeota bacterium]|nr:VTT domain-containing protein [Candidatus Eremiobacteraeota bacterium]